MNYQLTSYDDIQLSKKSCFTTHCIKRDVQNFSKIKSVNFNHILRNWCHNVWTWLSNLKSFTLSSIINCIFWTKILEELQWQKVIICCFNCQRFEFKILIGAEGYLNYTSCTQSWLPVIAVGYKISIISETAIIQFFIPSDSRKTTKRSKIRKSKDKSIQG